MRTHQRTHTYIKQNETDNSQTNKKQSITQQQYQQTKTLTNTTITTNENNNDTFAFCVDQSSRVINCTKSINIVEAIADIQPKSLNTDRVFNNIIKIIVITDAKSDNSFV